MNKISRGICVLVAMAMLSGCLTVTVDESTAFAPPKRALPPATSVAELDARYYAERLQTGVNKGFWRVEPTGDGATRFIYDSANRAESRGRPLPKEWIIRHGFVGEGTRRVAWTQYSRDTTTSPPNNPQRPLVVHCSGNAGDRYRSGRSYARDAFPWADVFVFDYPGYGDTPGPANAANFEAASQTLTNYIQTLSANRKLVFWGHSLGGFVCSRLASMVPHADGLILETTAPNAAAVARARIPVYARPFVRAKVAESLASYDVVEASAKINAPILVLGATKDEVLPVVLARQVAEGLKSRKADVSYQEFPEARHLGVPWQPNYNFVISAYFSKIESQP